MTLDQSEQKVVDNIREHGWHCWNVGADEYGPNFSYSVGWPETINFPDAAVFGLDPRLHHAMLWSLYDQLKGGLQLMDGLRVSELLEGHDCILREMDPGRASKYLTWSAWYSRHAGKDDTEFRAFQIFWPGAVDGLFPWQDGCNEEVAALQPLQLIPDGQDFAP